METYYADAKDAKEYHLKLFLFTFVIYGCFVAYANQWMSLTLMALITSVCVTRWLIAFHELFHLREAGALDFITRLQPIPFSPLNLGYHEYREIHRYHHIHAASEQDPDAFHIRGGFFKALLGSVTVHEQSTIRYIAKNGMSRELFVMMVFRFAIFTGLLGWNPQAFLIWWLVLRLTYIVNDFVFFHVVHFRSGKTGTFALPLPTWLKWVFIAIYGYDVVYATMHHDTHHRHYQVAAKNLPRVACLETGKTG